MVMKKAYKQGYKFSSKRANQANLVNTIGSGITNSLSAYLQKQEADKQDAAMQSFLGQVTGGQGGAAASAPAQPSPLAQSFMPSQSGPSASPYKNYDPSTGLEVDNPIPVPNQGMGYGGSQPALKGAMSAPALGGGGPAVAQQGAPVASSGGVQAAPQQVGGQSQRIMAALQANPQMLKTPMGQSLLQNYLAQQMAPAEQTIEIPGLGRVPLNSSSINTWGSLQSSKEATVRSAAEIEARRREGEAARQHAEDLAAAKIRADMLAKRAAALEAGKESQQEQAIALAKEEREYRRKVAFEREKADIAAEAVATGKTGLEPPLDPKVGGALAEYARGMGINPDLVGGLNQQGVSDVIEGAFSPQKDTDTPLVMRLLEAVLRTKVPDEGGALPGDKRNMNPDEAMGVVDQYIQRLGLRGGSQPAPSPATGGGTALQPQQIDAFRALPPGEQKAAREGLIRKGYDVSDL